MQTWKSLDNWSKVSEFLGEKYRRNIYKYLAIVRVSESAIAVRYQNTNIVTFYNDGQIEVFAANFQTSTTKKYINMFASQVIRIWQKNHKWFYSDNWQRVNKFDLSRPITFLV